MGGTATGPTAVDDQARRDQSLKENAERIAVPAFDIVTAPVEGLVEPAARAMPDAGKTGDGPEVAERDDRDHRA